MDIVERLRRMSDMTTTDNDLTDIAKAANEIELLRKERDGLREALSKIAQYDIQAWAIDALAPNSRILLKEDK